MITLDLLPKKTCSQCGARKSIARFYGDDRRPDRRQSCCKSCSYATQRRTIAKRADHYLAMGHRWQAANKMAAKTHSLRRNHGIDVEEYQRILDSQSGRCAICLKPHEFSKKFHVDHDHSTGVIRGILCHHCNTGIGLLGESPDRLAVASRYLTKSLPPHPNAGVCK